MRPQSVIGADASMCYVTLCALRSQTCAFAFLRINKPGLHRPVKDAGDSVQRVPERRNGGAGLPGRAAQQRAVRTLPLVCSNWGSYHFFHSTCAEQVVLLCAQGFETLGTCPVPCRFEGERGWVAQVQAHRGDGLVPVHGSGAAPSAF